MNREEFFKKLAENYSNYNNVIKPLVAEIEARSQNFPTPVFNEIRAFNDHIARCFLPDIDDQYINEQIIKAERHINRIILDCYKYLTVFLDDFVKDFDYKTRNIDLSVINNGEFYPYYKQLKQAALNKIRQAKFIESRKNDDAINVFQEAYNIYTDIEKIIYDNLSNVKWAKTRFTFRRILKIIIWIVAAILSGLISLFLSCDQFRFF